MGSFAKAALLAATLAAIAPVVQAQAQGRIEVQVTGRTDAGGATPACLLAVRLTNGGPTRISSFGAEVAAFDSRSGAELRLPPTTIAFLGVEPGGSKEWTAAGVTGARCEHVRLQVQRVTCVRRCGPGEWTQQGLAAVELAPR